MYSLNLRFVQKWECENSFSYLCCFFIYYKAIEMVMQFSEIKKIKETYEEGETNRLLSKGYVLIKILQTRRITNSDEMVRPMYILGK